MNKMSKMVNIHTFVGGKYNKEEYKELIIIALILNNNYYSMNKSYMGTQHYVLYTHLKS